MLERGQVQSTLIRGLEGGPVRVMLLKPQSAEIRLQLGLRQKAAAGKKAAVVLLGRKPEAPRLHFAPPLPTLSKGFLAARRRAHGNDDIVPVPRSLLRDWSRPLGTVGAGAGAVGTEGSQHRRAVTATPRPRLAKLQLPVPSSSFVAQLEQEQRASLSQGQLPDRQSGAVTAAAAAAAAGVTTPMATASAVEELQAVAAGALVATFAPPKPAGTDNSCFGCRSKQLLFERALAELCEQLEQRRAETARAVAVLARRSGPLGGGGSHAASLPSRDLLAFWCDAAAPCWGLSATQQAALRVELGVALLESPAAATHGGGGGGRGWKQPTAPSKDWCVSAQLLKKLLAGERARQAADGEAAYELRAAHAALERELAEAQQQSKRLAVRSDIVGKRLAFCLRALAKTKHLMEHTDAAAVQIGADLTECGKRSEHYAVQTRKLQRETEETVHMCEALRLRMGHLVRSGSVCPHSPAARDAVVAADAAAERAKLALTMPRSRSSTPVGGSSSAGSPTRTNSPANFA